MTTAKNRGRGRPRLPADQKLQRFIIGATGATLKSWRAKARAEKKPFQDWIRDTLDAAAVAAGDAP